MDIRKIVPQVFQFELTFVGEWTVNVQGQPNVKKHQFERGPKLARRYSTSLQPQGEATSC